MILGTLLGGLLFYRLLEYAVLRLTVTYRRLTVNPRPRVPRPTLPGRSLQIPGHRPTGAAQPDLVVPFTCSRRFHRTFSVLPAGDARHRIASSWLADFVLV